MAKVDWTALTDWRQALNWRSKVKSDEDVYQKSDQFTAKVLIPPKQATPKELAGALGIVIGDALSEDIWKFKGRIVGANSPHIFLPDPCDAALSIRPEILARLVALHTTFYGIGIKDFGKVKENDLVLVVLRPGKGPGTPFDLQIGQGLKKINTPGVVDWLKKLGDGEDKCLPLTELDWSSAQSAAAFRENRQVSSAFVNRPASDLSGLSTAELEVIQAEGTSRSLDDLHPNFRPEIDALIRMLADAGYTASISGTYRSDESQVAAYELERSEIKEGGSHSTTLDGAPASMAIDLINAEGNGWASTQSSFDFFEKMGEFAGQLGLTWGGNWDAETKTIDGKQYTIGWDPAHVEDPSYWGYTNT
jgi:hypothetical protein